MNPSIPTSIQDAQNLHQSKVKIQEHRPTKRGKQSTRCITNFNLTANSPLPSFSNQTDPLLFSCLGAHSKVYPKTVRLRKEWNFGCNHHNPFVHGWEISCFGTWYGTKTPKVKLPSFFCGFGCLLEQDGQLFPGQDHLVACAIYEGAWPSGRVSSWAWVSLV